MSTYTIVLLVLLALVILFLLCKYTRFGEAIMVILEGAAEVLGDIDFD